MARSCTSSSWIRLHRWQPALGGDDATDTAVDLIAELPPNDPAQLVAAGRVLELVTAATLDRTVLRQGIVSLEPGVFNLDFGQMTRGVEGILRGAELPVILHVVTDGQLSGLPTRFAELAPSLPAEIALHAVNDDEVEPNWAVESLAGSALSGELVATVKSFATDARDVRVSLELNGAVVEQKTLRIGAGERESLGFAALELRPGSNRVRALLSPDDSLAADNERMLALKRPVPRPVLLVSGDPRGDDTLFIDSAMASLTALALEVDTRAATDLAELTLTDYEFVVIGDAATVSDDQFSRLEAYVNDGGRALIVVGPRSTALTRVPITGQAFESATTTMGRGPQDYVSIGAMDSTHPIVRGLDTLRGARFTQHAGVVAGAEDDVLISLETSSPLLIERRLGSGRVLLFTSSIDRAWNDLPVHPVFVPFVAGLANHLLGGAGFSNEAELGSTLALRAMGMQGGQIFDPSGGPALGLGGGTDDVLLDQVGFYELAGGGRTELVAVNFDIRESDLAAIDAQTLDRWQGLGTQAQGERQAATQGSTRDPVLAPLGRWFLVLLILAAAMESWVGNWHLRVRRGIAA